MSQLSDQNILLRAQLSASGANPVIANHKEVTSDDHLKIEQLQSQIQSLINESSHQNTKITFYVSENSRLVTEIEQLRSASNDEANLRSENVELSAKVKSMSKDQDDLLELLADQDLKLKQYRKRLRELGEPIEASDDES
jgi:regulator of replication initiation timing